MAVPGARLPHDLNLSCKALMKRAFTLIELLVVIAIIAILAAILFPVFAKAKEAGKNVVAISNMKQVGTAALLYANDYDDNIVSSRNSLSQIGTEGAEWIWPFLFAPYTKNPPGNLGGDKSNVFNSPLGTKPQYIAGAARVFYARKLGLDKAFNLQLGADPNGTIAYPFWSTTTINEAAVEEWSNFSQYDEPAETFLFLEGADTEVEGDETLELYGRTQICPPDSDPSDYEMHAHRGGYSGGINITWIDAHVKWRKLVPRAGATPEDQWCQGLQFPPVTGSGSSNCGPWSAPADRLDPVTGNCTL